VLPFDSWRGNSGFPSNLTSANWIEHLIVSLLMSEYKSNETKASRIEPVPERKVNYMAANTKWFFEADYLQACNCDYGCPCEFSAPPTKGFCQGMGAWRISQGRCGDVPLNGLGLAFAAHWPKAIHEGNGTACIFVDEKASGPQREALLQIVSGQFGGLPFEIVVTTFSKVLEPRFVPFHFDFAGLNSSVRIGREITVATESIKNPVTGLPESVRVDHGTGFIFKSAECVSAREMSVDAGELKFSWPHKAGFVTQVKYGN
jgi:hypothetical protein